jgi:hypothetical protein
VKALVVIGGMQYSGGVPAWALLPPDRHLAVIANAGHVPLKATVFMDAVRNFLNRMDQ